jgi:hypothetical protein
VDVQFVLDEAAPGDGNFWDCVAGYGETTAARAAAAGRLWAQTTGSAVLELKYSGTGQFADHYRGNDPGGLYGWHTIHGGIVGFGLGDSPDRLQEWWLSNPVLPALSRPLEGSLRDRECPAGLKIMFGGESIAEVRVRCSRCVAMAAHASGRLCSVIRSRTPPGSARRGGLEEARSGMKRHR